tara:strand:- start:3919 stop:4938 length:1020 start_codon:yes stop_codon:yes gene_type:complete
MATKALKKIPDFIKIPKIKIKPSKPNIKPPKPKSSGAKINEKIKEIKPKTTTIKEGTAPKKTFMQKAMPYASLNVLNPATKARKRKTALMAVTGASTLPGIFGGGDEDNVESGQDFTISNNNDLEDLLNQDKDGFIPDTDPTAWAEIMKARIVNDRGIPLDDKGNFTTKPKFMDYLKSLPKAYMDKVSVDKDFAKKMMAGFLNMMKPVAGPVPINPFVAFGEGYLGEESRQADMLPADVQTLKFLQDNPRLADLYQKNLQAGSGVLLADTKADVGEGYYNQLVATASLKQNIPIDKIANGTYQLTYKGVPVGPSDITGLLGQGVSIVANEDFKLELRKE